MLEQGNNPNEWVKHFVVKLCDKTGPLATYDVQDFKTNLPHIPTIFEPINNINQMLVRNKSKQIIIDTSNKINPKTRLTPQEIMQLKKDKKIAEVLKKEAEKNFKLKQQETNIIIKTHKILNKTTKHIVIDKEY